MGTIVAKPVGPPPCPPCPPLTYVGPSGPTRLGDDLDITTPTLGSCLQIVESLTLFEDEELVAGKYLITNASVTPGLFGRTYFASSVLNNNAPCVLRVISVFEQPKVIIDVRDDQKVLSKLQHANISNVLDVMEDETHETIILVSPFFITGSVDRLAGQLQLGKAEDRDVLQSIAQDICSGLRVLHSHQLYHGHLKLRNVVEVPQLQHVCASGSSGAARKFAIIDIGLQKFLTYSTIETVRLTGDISVMPPEMFLIGPMAVDAVKADVWALGLLLYELVYGHPAFSINQSMSLNAVEDIILHAPLKFPSRAGDVPADFVEVLQACLERNPSQRPNVQRLLRMPYFRINVQQLSFFGRPTAISSLNPGNLSTSSLIVSNKSGAGGAGGAGGGTASERSSFMGTSAFGDPMTPPALNLPLFDIELVLGKGRRSETLLVRQGHRGHELAFKMIDSSIFTRINDPHQIISEANIRKAVAMSKKIKHQNVCSYADVVDDGRGVTFVTQRYFPRGNIAANFPKLEERKGALVVLLLADVLRGLMHLHDNRLYHLNLSPSNIFYDADDCYVMTDFGPVMCLFTELIDKATGECIVDLPGHMVRCATSQDAVQFIDTFCVGLLALSAIPEFRLVVWQQYLRQSVEEFDLDAHLKRLDGINHLPPNLVDFIKVALTQKPTARQLLVHPLLTQEISLDALVEELVTVAPKDVQNAIRVRFPNREENRMASLGLGSAAYLTPAAYGMDMGVSGRLGSMSAMFGAGPPTDYQAGPLTSAHDLRTPPVTPALDELPEKLLPCSIRIQYAFDTAMLCGVCKLELKLVVYRCDQCRDYIRCGKCANNDNHNDGMHGALEPYIVESILIDDEDDDIKTAMLVSTAEMTAFALEEIEMQADLPTGSLSKGNNSNTPDSRSASMVRSSSVEQSPRTPLAGLIPVKGNLLKEEEANDQTPEEVIESCRRQKTNDLMLNNLAITVVPMELFSPPSEGKEGKEGKELPMELFSPPPLWSSTQIRVLDLCNNKLTSLPEEIGLLKSLVKLSVANNNLLHLPDGIKELTDLQFLDVSHNGLSDLPQSIMFLDVLETIVMDYNDCGEIPAPLFDLEGLRVVYLAENRRIDHWPQLVLLQQLRRVVMFILDNEPKLLSGYTSISACMPNVSVMWNKIYPDEIYPNLYCGSLRSAQSMTVYDRLSVGYLLTVGRNLAPIVPPDMKHKVVIVDDIEGAAIDFAFEEAIAFIDEAIQAKTGCLVHCFAGMSRSATTVIAYLMMRQGMRLDEAYCTTKRGRPAIYPNAGFFKQLLALDAKLYPGQRPLDMESMERHKVPSA